MGGRGDRGNAQSSKAFSFHTRRLVSPRPERSSKLESTQSLGSQALIIMIQEISIPDSLYEQASTLAQEMQISPSDLVSLAIKEYLQRHHSQKLLYSINEAYADGLDDGEQAMLEGMRRHQRQLLENE